VARGVALSRCGERLREADEGWAEVDERFRQVDVHLAVADRHFARVDVHLAAADVRFAQVDVHLAEVAVDWRKWTGRRGSTQFAVDVSASCRHKPRRRFDGGFGA